MPTMLLALCGMYDYTSLPPSLSTQLFFWSYMVRTAGIVFLAVETFQNIRINVLGAEIACVVLLRLSRSSSC